MLAWRWATRLQTARRLRRGARRHRHERGSKPGSPSTFPAPARRSLVERIAGGHSNLTFRVSDSAGGAGRCGGRRSASGSARPTTWPASTRSSPRSRDRGPGGAGVGSARTIRNRRPFYAMGVVEGPILRGLAEAEIFPEKGRPRAIGQRVADTLAAIHAVDPDAVGLGDLGRKEDYVARQLHPLAGASGRSRRRASWGRSTPSTSASPPASPSRDRATIVHGDYRLDNMILTPSGEVAAVVDWELCTLGDPMADVGLLMAYWPTASRRTSPSASPPTSLPASHPRGTGGSLRQALRPRPLRPRLLSSPSATGSWRSSSRASTPATPPVATARSTTAFRRSRGWWSGWPRPRDEAERRDWSYLVASV